MPKKPQQAKEWVLNIAFNRWQFNRPRYVGKLAEAIRACAPHDVKEWEEYYLQNVRPTGGMLGETMAEHLEEVGRRLYAKISEQLRAEVDAITEQDCINYVHAVVIERTFQGYQTEKRTVYEQLEQQLGVALSPAPDEWDRRYNVDFFVQIGNAYIGIQIKPTTYTQMAEAHKWLQQMRASHQRFERKHGGKVFVVFSVTQGNSKVIANPDVVDAIKAEIERLRNK